MASRNPLVLITNDDGISHLGLAHLAEAMAAIGEIVVVAPETDQTSMGRSFPSHSTTGAITSRALPTLGSELSQIFSIEGSPAQAVSYAVLELCPRKPDICVVGINEGLNVGTTITGSGTIGAALEAHAYGIPSIAISVESCADGPVRDGKWMAASNCASKLAAMCLARSDREWLLNINVPNDATETTAIRHTFQSLQPYYYFRARQRRTLTAPTKLELYHHVDTGSLEDGSDIDAVVNHRLISVTPLQPTLGCPRTQMQERLDL